MTKTQRQTVKTFLFNATHKGDKLYSRLQFLLLNHLRALSLNLGILSRNPLASLMTILVIAIAVSLPAGLFSILQNFQQLGQQWGNKPSISLYLKNDTEYDKINLLMKKLSANTSIAQVHYISPARGLKQFKKTTHLTDILSTLDSNPLPPVIVITPQPRYTNAAALNKLVNKLKSETLVDTMQVDSTWVKRLAQLVTLTKRITYIMSLLFSIGVILIVFNTIRLIIQNHQQEITTLGLIGAPHSFIQRPFLYRGLLFGLCGGLLAWIIVSITLKWLSAPTHQLIQSYGSNFTLNSFSLLTALGIVLISSLLSLIGSWIALRRYLSVL